MRRLVTVLVALCLGALALMGGTGVASAAPRTAPAAEICPNVGTLYPPSPDATIMSSTTTPFIGQHIEASGIKYCPNEDVRLTIAGAFVGTAHTNADGSFDPQVVVPGPVGDKLLCGVGASGLSLDQDCLTLHVRAEGSNGGGTPLGSTGVEIATIIAVALVLLGGGVLFVTAGRRRKSARV